MSDSDWQQLLINSTAVRAHPCTAEAEKSSVEAEALGRSQGGFSTKIHAVTEAWAIRCINHGSLFHD